MTRKFMFDGSGSSLARTADWAFPVPGSHKPDPSHSFRACRYHVGCVLVLLMRQHRLTESRESAAELCSRSATVRVQYCWDSDGSPAFAKQPSGSRFNANETLAYMVNDEIARYALVVVQCATSAWESSFELSGEFSLLNPSMASLQGKAKEVRPAATMVKDISTLDLHGYFHGMAYDWGLKEFYGYLCAFYTFASFVVAWKIYDNLDKFITAHMLSLFAFASKAFETLLRRQRMGMADRDSLAGKQLESLAVLAEAWESFAFLVLLSLVASSKNPTRIANPFRQDAARAAVAGNTSFIVVFVFYGVAASMRSVCPLEGNTPQCGVLTLTEYVVRSLIMLAILVSLNFKITLLLNSSRAAEWQSPQSALEYTHMTLYTSVRWAFLAYL